MDCLTDSLISIQNILTWSYRTTAPHRSHRTDFGSLTTSDCLRRRHRRRRGGGGGVLVCIINQIIQLIKSGPAAAGRSSAGGKWMNLRSGGVVMMEAESGDNG